MKYFKYSWVSLLCMSFVFSGNNVSGIDVDIDELKKVQKVEFKNYEGKHKKIDRISAIKGIGRSLAKGVKRGGVNKTTFFAKKYTMVHTGVSKSSNKLSADIFSILPKARVDHIKNIRRIIAGYLEEKYQYSKEHAHTLSVFLTYYNAVYHQDMAYFSLKYDEGTLQFVNKKYAGLSVNYEDWPGNTKIFIPVTKESKRNELDSISLDVISDTNVKKIVREEDENIEERKDMVDMKEEVIERDEERVEEKEAELVKKQKLLDKIDKVPEEEKTEEVKKEIKKEEKKIEEGMKEVKKEKKKIEERKKAVAKEKEEIKKDELAKKEKDLDKREDALRSEKVDKNIYGDKLYYIKVSKHIASGHYNNRMYIINTRNQEIEKEAALKNICGTKYDIFGEGVMVITYRTNHYKPHRLTLLDRNTLKPKKYSKAAVYWKSFVILKEDFVFIITMKDNQFYLGKFDKDLNLVAQSKDKIFGDTFISFFGDHLYVNSWDGNILVLKAEDLSVIDLIEPGDDETLINTIKKEAQSVDSVKKAAESVAGTQKKGTALKKKIPKKSPDLNKVKKP